MVLWAIDWKSRVVGEDVGEGEGAVRVLIGEQNAEDTHKDGNMQDSLVTKMLEM
jgi:hypothetical protein